MATVEDDISCKGPLGKITIYKLKEVCKKRVARSVSGLTADQIKKDPARARSR